MKIVSYNVNGIRAAIGKDFIGWLKEANPDVLCIQETKANPSQFDVSLFEELGYHCYWHSAEKKGYSGVGLLTKIKPDSVSYGVGVDRFDSEGRLVRADIGDLTILSVYHPSGTTGGPRQDFKMEWLENFHTYANELKKERPNIIVSGDVNICHKEIDISNPKKKKGVSGFLPEEREWVSNFIESGFIDTFRVFDESPEKYSWWSYRAGSRAKNLGWRIDYHFATESLKDKLKDAAIWSDVVHSDHCPIYLEIENNQF